MNIIELKSKIDNAIEFAKDNEEDPEKILVSLQIDSDEGESIWADKHLELHYDGNLFASGCVITASRDDD